MIGLARASVRGRATTFTATFLSVLLGTVLIGGWGSAIVLFSVARHEGLVPDGQLWLPPSVMAGAVALTLLAARRTVTRPDRPEGPR